MKDAVANIIKLMKTPPLLLTSILGLTLLVSPVRAEELSQIEIPPEMQKIMSELVKSTSKSSSDSSAKDDQGLTMEKLQPILVSLLKAISKILPDLIASLESDSSASFKPTDFDLSDNSASPDPSLSLSTTDLNTGSLRTNSLTTGGLGGPRLNSEQWRMQFQRSGDRR